MVARPAVTPDFATGGGRRLEPDAGEKSNGFREGYRFAARKANWALGYVADWIAYLAAIVDANEEHTYQTAKTRKTVVSLWDAQLFDGDSSTAAAWTRHSNFAGNYYWESVSAQVQLAIPLNNYLRDGQTLEEIKIIWKPTAANASSGDRNYAALVSVDPNFGTPAAPSPSTIAFIDDDGTANFQTRTITAAATIDRDGDDAKDYFLVVIAANEAGGDRLHGVQLLITDRGPRNV